MRSQSNFKRWVKTIGPEFFIRPNGLGIREGLSCSTGCPAKAWCKTFQQRIEIRTCAERFLAWANSEKEA